VTDELDPQALAAMATAATTTHARPARLARASWPIDRRPVVITPSNSRYQLDGSRGQVMRPRGV